MYLQVLYCNVLSAIHWGWDYLRLQEMQGMIHLMCICRGDYGVDVGRNIIHGSDAVEVRR